MTTTSNPLTEMTETIAFDSSGEARPTESFQDTALPGFKQALTARRSMRVFDGEPMPEAVMRDCLRDAILAPSASNLQPYELYWVRDPDKKAQVAAACLGQPAAMTAGDLVVVVARGDLWDVNRRQVVDAMTKHGTKPLSGALDDYYNRLTPWLLKTDALGFRNLMRRVLLAYKGRNEPMVRGPVNRGDHRVWAHTQSSLAAQTLMLSLSAHGYESCPIGGLDSLRIRRVLELPKQAEVTMVIAAGRGKPEGLYGRRLRLPDGDLIKEV